MPDSKFYVTDPDDPEAPVVLTEHHGPHGVIRPGDTVTYENVVRPALKLGMEGEHTVTEIIDFGGGHPVQAVLDNGEYECGADNLRPEAGQTGV